MGWIIAIIIKPLGLILFLGFACWLSRMFSKLMPEGRLKRILFFSWRV